MIESKMGEFAALVSAELPWVHFEVKAGHNSLLMHGNIGGVTVTATGREIDEADDMEALSKARVKSAIMTALILKDQAEATR